LPKGIANKVARATMSAHFSCARAEQTLSRSPPAFLDRLIGNVYLHPANGLRRLAMRPWALILALLCLLTAASASADNDTPTAVKKILAARADHFLSLQGSAGQGIQYAATLAPPNVECEILHIRLPVVYVAYSCHHQPRMTQAEAQRTFDLLKGALITAAPTWKWFKTPLLKRETVGYNIGLDESQIVVHLSQIADPTSEIYGIFFRVTDVPFNHVGQGQLVSP
jgi:hypothetical protein